MKNETKHKLRFKLSIFAVIIFTLFASATFGQVEYSDVVKFQSEIGSDITIEFKNRSFDVEIRTWDKSSVEMQMQVKLRAKKQEDIDLTLEAINNIEFKNFGDKFLINTLFWDSRTCNINQKLKLKTGEKVVLKSFDVRVALYIPKTASIEIDNKYADIKMEEIVGEAVIKMYNGKFYGQSFGAPVIFDMRYSKAFLGSVPEAEMKLYDSDIELETCGNLKLESKYSKIEIEQTGNLDFNSYDDNFTIGKLGKVEGEAKYTDFDFGPSVNLLFKFYDCNFNGGSTGNVMGQSKYTEMEIANAETVVLTSSYDDTFVFGDVVSFECSESKYTDFNFRSLAERFELLSFDDNVIIENISPNFSQISINGKYGDYRMTFSDDAAYQLLVDMKYGKVDYPENLFTRKTYIKENSNMFMDASTKNSSGKTLRVVEIKGYDNKVFIK